MSMKETISASIYPQCPIRNVLARISDKWSLLVLYALSQASPLRFVELRHQIGDATSKMLASALHTLEEDGFISRTVYAEIPPRVEYALTIRGKDLLEKLQPLIEWSNEHMEEILRERMAKAKPRSVI